MGLTPSEKKRYNESKKRRRQAYESYETGKIKPIRSKGKIIAAAVAAALAVVIGVLIFTVTKQTGQDGQSYAVQANETRNSAGLLRIVSARYPAEKDEVPKLAEFNGFRVNEVLLKDLQDMFDSAKQKGITLKIKSAYLSYGEQEKLFEAKLKEVRKNKSYSQVRAAAVASAEVSKAGESEAQLGMLVDFDSGDSKTKAFLDREGINFGFILRFPKEKEDLTHHNYSPSLYRYVGKDYAEKMRTLNMCLEEFADYEAEN